MTKMSKKLHEDVNTIYKVIGIVYPDVEDTEVFDSKEDAMDYAQEQISSGDYDEVIASEVTIDEDGYEDETILLDEQGKHGDEEYEPQLTTDRMNAGQWYESLHEEKDKYSVLREALDSLDEEAGKDQVRIRGLRSKLKESYGSSALFNRVVSKLRKDGYIVDIADYINQVYQEYCYQIASARKRTPEDDPDYTGKFVKDDRYLDEQGLFGIFDHYDESTNTIRGTEFCVGDELFPAKSRTVLGICEEIKQLID